MKKLVASMRIALRALRVNRMRSALTMLGIIIGVAAVIAMVGVGAGATARIQEQIQSIGSNLIIVLPGSISSNGVRLGSGGVATLTEDDAKAIAAECPSVALAAPTVRGGVQVVYGNNNWATNAQGVTPDYMTIRDYTMMSGQFFTDAGRGRRRQVGGAGRNRRAESVRRQRPHRPGGHHQERAVHRGGRADAERPVADRARTRTTSSCCRSPRPRRRCSAPTRPMPRRSAR